LPNQNDVDRGLSPSTKLYLDYDGRFNSDYTQNVISAGVPLKL